MVWPTVVLAAAPARKANGQVVTVTGVGLLMGQMLGKDGQPRGWLVSIGHSMVTVPLDAVRLADGKGGRR